MQIMKGWTERSYNSYNQAWYDSSGQVADVLSDSRTTPPNKTPRGGWRPPTPYFRNVETNANTVTWSGRCDQYAWYGTNKGEHAGASNCSGYWYTALPSFPGSLQVRCEIGARLKLKNEGINIATNLGERAQTARLVAENCKRLHDIVVGIRRGNINEIANAIGVNRRSIRNGAPFDMWLELQYGWKPLLGDVHSAVTQLSNDETGNRPPIVTVTKTGEENDLFYSYPTTAMPCAYVYFKKRHEVKHKCKVRLDFIPGNDVLRTAAQCGLTNPFELAWELLPFSFVVDWFFPVGDYFAQLDATLGFDFKGGSISKKTTMRTKAESVSIGPDSSGFPVSGYASAYGSGYQMAFSRTPYGSCPLPLPNLSLKDKSSSQHVANGIALLASAFTKKVRG